MHAALQHDAVLPYVQALAGPAAALASVWLVAARGLASFRRQKAIERRLDWYESVYRLLGRTGNVYLWAASAAEHGEVDRAAQRVREALEVSQDLAGISADCWLYATQSGFEAIGQLTAKLAKSHVGARADGVITRQLANQVADLCNTTALTLAADIRREMQLPALLWRPSRTGSQD